MDGNNFIMAWSGQPIIAIFAYFFCKAFLYPNQKELLIVDGMGKDIIRSVSSVRNIDTFLMMIRRRLLLIKESAESPLFIHFMYSLKFNIQENIIKDIIKGI